MTFKMKTLAAALTVGTFAAASATAAPIGVTGYNIDIVAEGSADILVATSGGSVVTQEWTVVAAGYTGEGALTAGTPLSITSDTVTSKNGTVFGLDADANNALNSDGTLTLVTPGKYEDLQFLIWSAGNTTVKVTLNFSDASTTEETESLSGWTGSATNNAFDSSTTSIRRENGQQLGLFARELDFSLSLVDQAKTLNSITFDFQDDLRESVFGVSGTPVPEPGSLALLGLGGLLIARRRRG